MVKSTIPASCIALLLANSAMGCGAKTAGEIMLGISSDMSLPKDVDRIRIEVLVDGSKTFDQDYSVGSEGTKLPGTLAVVHGADPATPVTMRVVARQRGKFRVVAESVSTIPENRVATLRLPIDWLCDGTTKPDGEGDAVSACPEGQACLAGSCVDHNVDSSSLPEYVPQDLFGGGTGAGDGSCFDTQPCFDGSQDAMVDLAACTLPPPSGGKGVNVAIRTEGDGICGVNGCLVPLDGNSDAGWKESGGAIHLPLALCKRLGDGTAAAVAVSTACATKTASLPTCGPWSSAGGSHAPAGNAPLTLAAAQDHPVAIAVDSVQVYWLSSGVFGMSSGVLKSAPLKGGTPTKIVGNLPGPRDLAMNGTFAYWSNTGPTGTGDGSIMSFDVTTSASSAQVLASKLNAPEGVTVTGKTVFFAGFGDGTIDQAGVAAPLASMQNYPVRIALSPDHQTLFWTNEGTLNASDGSVSSLALSGKSVVALAMAQKTPRAIAVDAAHVYWTTFSDPDGSVMSAGLDGKNPITLAKNQSLPAGIAVDDANVYWTNRGDGTVWSAPKGGGVPVALASGQYKPAAITVDAKSVYWVNEGSADKADGSIVTVAKP